MERSYGRPFQPDKDDNIKSIEKWQKQRDDFEKKDRRAWGLIIKYTDVQPQAYIVNKKKSGLFAWKTLKDLYSDTDLPAVENLYNELHTLRLNSYTSVDAYTARFIEIMGRLKSVGYNIPDWCSLAAYKRGLGDAFEAFVLYKSEWAKNDEIPLTVDTLSQELIVLENSHI